MANIGLVRVSTEWVKIQDLIDGFNPVSNSKYLIQAKGYDSLQIFEGANRPNDEEQGFEIQQFKTYIWTCVNGEHLWVKAKTDSTIFNIADRVSDGGGSGGDSKSVVIESASSTVVEGHSVPTITASQLVTIYNSIMVDRKTCYILSSSDQQMYLITGVETDGENIFAYMTFAYELLVCYESGEDDNVIISARRINKIAEINIGEYQYTHEGYVLPAIEKSVLDTIYNNKKNRIQQQLKWELVGEMYLDVISADKIAGNYSIDIVVHNKYHCSYTWTDSTTGVVNPEVETLN